MVCYIGLKHIYRARSNYLRFGGVLFCLGLNRGNDIVQTLKRWIDGYTDVAKEVSCPTQESKGGHNHDRNLKAARFKIGLK